MGHRFEFKEQKESVFSNFNAGSTFNNARSQPSSLEKHAFLSKFWGGIMINERKNVKIDAKRVDNTFYAHHVDELHNSVSTLFS